MILGIIPDIDGVFLLFDQNLYRQYHHTFGHSLFFGLLVMAVLLPFGKNRKKLAWAGSLTFLAHLAADVVGSGWGITLFYPMSDHEIGMGGILSFTMIYDVIGPGTFILVLVTIVIILFRKEVSPIEFFSVKLDRWVVRFYTHPFKYRCGICGKWAFTECSECRRKVCPRHTGDMIRSRCTECGKE